MSRYEVRGLQTDKELVRVVAQRLAAADAGAARLRNELSRNILSKSLRRGGIVATLLSSPPVGANLQIERTVSA